ncbi:MAG TPA: HD domain-containing protein [Chitinophagales bacterium]|nr:HD domain-containing protein [Chitinophagales bacterium]HRK28110.1 HD domain-containing protein [Chitinophagales bacterium]
MFPLPIPPKHLKLLQTIGKIASQLGYPAYVIGGYVRDLLLNRPCKDIDIVCQGSGIELAAAAAQQIPEAGKLVVYKHFGTAVFRVDDLELEFVGARKESYDRSSRKPHVEDGTLEDDQNRRDFTINALAFSINPANFGAFIDPFNGLDDLQNGIIKTPLSNPDITFSDDPLRMMRAVRFATQLHFTIDPHTLQAITTNKERLRIISMERIIAEFNKIILSPKPSIGIKLLMDTGLLGQFFPELHAMRGIDTQNGVAHKDNFYHTLKVLDNLCLKSDDLWLRWAALLHDIGKPKTKCFDEQENDWTFHGHESVGADMTVSIFKRLKLPLNEHLQFVRKLVGMHQRPIFLTNTEPSDSALRRLLFEAGNDLDALMTLCRADMTSKNEEKVKRYLQNYDILVQKLYDIEKRDQLRYWQPPIDGAIIMQTFGIQPGKQVGEIKTAIREAILDGEIPNDYEAAYAFMLQKAAQMQLLPVS